MPYSCHVFSFPRAKYFYSLLFTKMQVTLCVHAKSLQLCSTLQRYGLQPARLLCPWGSPDEDTGVGCHALLQGNPPDPGIKPVSLMSLALACGFFTTGATSVPAKSLQSCPTLCNTVDCSWPGFSVHGILQARILEWAPISFSRKITLLVFSFPEVSPFSFTSQKSPSYTQVCFLVYNCYHS